MRDCFLKRDFMANILYIAQFFSTETEPGGQGQRHYKHAKALAESGHHVTVITSGTTTMSAPLPVVKKNGKKGEKNAKKENSKINIAASPSQSSKRIPDGSLTVIHIPTVTMSKRSVLSRAYRYFEFSFKALLKGVELTLNPSNLFHYVLGSSPPILIGLIAYILSVLARAEFILEVRDLWSQTMESNGFINNRWIIDVNRALESFLYRASKKIIVVSDAFIPVIEDQVDGSDAKLINIPNGADLEFYEYPLMWQGTYFSDDTESPERVTETKKNFNVVYAGVFSDYTNVESILETASLLQKTHPHIKFHLAGGGYQEQELKALKESMRLENVYFWGVLPKQRISKFISEGDVSLINYRDLDIYGKVLPNKLFDYLAAANPIIACAPKGSVTDVIEASNSGFCLTPEKPIELANKLVWLSENPNDVTTMGKQGKDYVREHFNRDTLVRQFVGLFPSLIPFPQSGSAQDKPENTKNNLLDFRRKLP